MMTSLFCAALAMAIHVNQAEASMPSESGAHLDDSSSSNSRASTSTSKESLDRNTASQQSANETTMQTQSAALQATNIEGQLSAGTLTMEQIKAGLSQIIDFNLVNDSGVDRVLKASQQNALATGLTDFADSAIDKVQGEIKALQAKKDLTESDKTKLKDLRTAETNWLSIQSTLAKVETDTQENLKTVVTDEKTNRLKNEALALVSADLEKKSSEYEAATAAHSKKQAEEAALKAEIAKLEKGELGDVEKAKLDAEFDLIVKKLQSSDQKKLKFDEVETTEAGKKYLTDKVSSYVAKNESEWKVARKAYMNEQQKINDVFDHLRKLKDGWYGEGEAENVLKNKYPSEYQLYLDYKSAYDNPDKIAGAANAAKLFPGKTAYYKDQDRLENVKRHAEELSDRSFKFAITSNETALDNAKAKLKVVSAELITAKENLLNTAAKFNAASDAVDKAKQKLNEKNYVADAKTVLLEEQGKLQIIEGGIEQAAKEAGKTKEQFLKDLEYDKSDKGRTMLLAYKTQIENVNKATQLVAAVDQADLNLKKRTREPVPGIIPGDDGTITKIASNTTPTPEGGPKIATGPSYSGSPNFDVVADGNRIKAKFSMSSAKQ